MEKSMYDFWELLKTEVSLYDGYMFEPQEKINNTSKIIGELPDNLKRLYSYMIHCYTEAEKLLIEFNRNKQDKEKLSLYHMYHDKGETLRLILWANISEIFKVWGEDLSLKSGWKIIEISNSPDIFKSLREMLGM